MPVAVDAQVTPSRQRWLYLCMPLAIGAALLFLIHAPWFAYLLWLSCGWVVFHIYQCELSVTSIRVDGELVSLWVDEQCSHWVWHGRGRLSHAFIEMILVSDESQSYRLRLWRDAVSEPSWRALNMAYRVNVTHARQATADQISPAI